MLAYLSLGSNLGNREDTLAKATQLIHQQVGSVLRQSSHFYSEPWGFESPHGFCNICLAIETTLSPIDLLHATQQIEQQLGRTHKGGTYRDRTIDIDILLYENLHINTPELTIPHPLMQQRDFVMIPLQEILNL